MAASLLRRNSVMSVRYLRRTPEDMAGKAAPYRLDLIIALPRGGKARAEVSDSTQLHFHVAVIAADR